MFVQSYILQLMTEIHCYPFLHHFKLGLHYMLVFRQHAEFHV